VTPSTTYVCDQALPVVATPNAGWQFVNWTGVGAVNLVDANAASTTITNPTYGDTAIQANFVKITYTLTTSVSPVGGGTVTASTTYVYDDGLAVVATPNAGWQFVNWTGVGAGNLVSTTSASTTIINPTFAGTDMQANFVLIEYSYCHCHPTLLPLRVRLSNRLRNQLIAMGMVTLTAVDTYHRGSLFK
jgi:hypothetical protein